jgi:hypothetical protein
MGAPSDRVLFLTTAMSQISRHVLHPHAIHDALRDVQVSLFDLLPHVIPVQRFAERERGDLILEEALACFSSNAFSFGP